MKYTCILLASLLLTPVGFAAEIHDAVEADDPARIQQIVQRNPEALEERNDQNFTPLIQAAVDDKVEAARALIALGASVSAGDNEGSTALHNAAANGELEIVRMLLDAGAGPDLADSRGMTPAIFASFWGRIGILELLLEAGARVDAMNGRGWTGLHGAAYFGREEMVVYLINRQVDVNQCDTYGYTAFHLAALRGQDDMMKLLLDNGADPRIRLNDRRNIVHLCAERNDTTCLRLCIEAGVDVNTKDNLGRVPLHITAFRRAPEAAKMLLKHGADPNIANEEGRTPLLEAVRHGNPAMVGPLVAAGADVTVLDPVRDQTALHIAAINGLNEAVPPLIVSLANDINRRDKNGMTAADYAAKYAHKNIASQLMAAGGTCDKKNQQLGKRCVLDEPVKNGEAALTYLGHCGWAVKTASKVLVFDYFNPGVKPSNPCLANGRLCPIELKGQEVYVFITHDHSDHLDTCIFALADSGVNVTYIAGVPEEVVVGSGEDRREGIAVDWIEPHTEHDYNGMKVSTIEANDAGVGFLVEVDGLTLYHAGDHAGWAEGAKDEFTGEIDWLVERTDDVDMAFLNVTGCHVQDTIALMEGTEYTLEQLTPKLFIPTHGYTREWVYKEAADKVQAKYPQLQAACPEYRGDRYVYRNGEIM